MKYVIMCGGSYDQFETPRQLSVINGERIADRTVRLLREAGAEDICISATDERFDSCGVPRLVHQNNFRVVNGKAEGYWLDAFYPFFDANQKVTFIFGDVYFTEEAIRRIVSFRGIGNVLFGTSDAKNELHENWGEPFAYVVNDYATFMQGVRSVKILQDLGLLKRCAIVWELYRFLNHLDVNVQAVLPETYVCIDDGTLDVDTPAHIDLISRRFSCSSQ